MIEEINLTDFQALSYDKDFYNLLQGLKDNYIGRVHSIYSRVINFVNKKGKIYSITSEGVDYGPFSLRLASRKIDFKDLGIKEGDRLFKAGKSINIAGKVRLRIDRKTSLWIANNKKVRQVNKERLNKNINYFNKLILEKESISGSKYYYFRDNPRFKYQPQLMERELANRIGRFLKDISQDNLQESSVASLIGLGIGLTPSGDDFLVGFIAVLNIIDIAYSNYLKEKISRLIRLDKLSTTDISKHILENALEGKFSQGILNFIYSLLEEDKERLEKSIKNILNIGSSSGMDLSIGIVLAMQVLMNNFNMEE